MRERPSGTIPGDTPDDIPDGADAEELGCDYCGLFFGTPWKAKHHDCMGGRGGRPLRVEPIRDPRWDRDYEVTC